MKILHLNTFENRGGAAIAASRLHQALLSNCVNSILAVANKKTEDTSVVQVTAAQHKFVFGVNTGLSMVNQLVFGLPRATYFSVSYPWSLAKKEVEQKDYDILHLHWLSYGMLNPKHLLAVKDKPIVWTLHDLQSLTGGDHYPKNDLYITGYQSTKSLVDKLQSRIWRSKKKIYDQLTNLHFVAPSQWVADIVQASKIAKNHSVHVLPNLLNTKLFQPIEKLAARRSLGLPLEKKIILTGASNSIIDSRKGWHQLTAALQVSNMKALQQQATLVVFGINKQVKISGWSVHSFGKIKNTNQLVQLYSAADVMVVPSLVETFGQTASEAMACGTPVVCYDTSGLKDIVEHKVTGYRAKLQDVQDLANGIQYVLSSSSQLQSFSMAAREKAVRKFSEDVAVKKFIDLYASLM